MRRQRHAIRVDTFPFLAVLLCAMGSLILLLLVIDRRAKIAARARVHESAAAAAERRAKLAAFNQAEWERKCRELHEALARQEEELRAQLQAILGQSANVGQKVQTEQAQIRDLHHAIGKQKENIEKQRGYISRGRDSLAKASEQEKAAQKELERLARDLDALETTLRNLKELRLREQQTFSLVPYHGRHGDRRKPIYVECSSHGLVFHPGHRSLSSFELTSEGVRREVERLAGTLLGRPSLAATENPYLLFLVRPDGIANYYQAQDALQRLPIDYGYELVESDWVFDFSSEETADSQPWRAANSVPGSAGFVAGRPRSAPPPLEKRTSADPVAGYGTGFNGGFSGSGASGQGTGNGPPGFYGGSVSGLTGQGPAGPAHGGGVAGIRAPGSGAGVRFGPPGIGPTGGIGPGGGNGPPGSGARTGNGVAGMAPGVTGQATGMQGVPGTALRPGAPAGPVLLWNPDPSSAGVSGIPVTGTPPPPGPWQTGRPRFPTGNATGAVGIGIDQPRLRAGDPYGGGTSGCFAMGPGSAAGLATPRDSPPTVDGNPWRPRLASAAGTANNNGTGSAVASGYGSQYGAYGGPPGQPGATAAGQGSGTGSGGDSGSTAGPSGQASGSGATGGSSSQAGGMVSPGAGAAGAQGQQGGAQGGGMPSLNLTLGKQPPPSGGGVPPPTAPNERPPDRRPEDPSWQATAGQIRGNNQGGYTGGGGGGGEPGDGPAMPILPGPLASMQRPEKRRPMVPLSRLLGNRDFIILLECKADTVIIQPWGTRFPIGSLPDTPDKNHALVRTIEQIIARRQASVREGEAPYRPLLRFQIHPDGLRAFYLTYPLLDCLKIPMSRENLDQ